MTLFFLVRLDNVDERIEPPAVRVRLQQVIARGFDKMKPADLTVTSAGPDIRREMGADVSR